MKTTITVFKSARKTSHISCHHKFCVMSADRQTKIGMWCSWVGLGIKHLKHSSQVPRLSGFLRDHAENVSVIDGVKFKIGEWTFFS